MAALDKLNGAGNSVLEIFQKLEPGTVVVGVILGLVLIINLDNKLDTTITTVTVMERDVQALASRVDAENATTVDIRLHQEQIESIHFRIGELRERIEKVEDAKD